MTDVVVTDTCSLVNFAVVRRSDLLAGVFDGQVRCVEAVRQEVVELSLTVPALLDLLAEPWLGSPIVFDDPADIAAIEKLRRTALGGRRSTPRQHLGEAQSLHALAARPSLIDAVLLTDDRAALDHARRRGLRVMDTADVLSEAYDRGLAGCPEAYELLNAMRAAERGVRVPASHLQVCPP